MHEADIACLTSQTTVQDVLGSHISNGTSGNKQSSIHFHTLKSVRQLGGNSTSFPTAAEVCASNGFVKVCIYAFEIQADCLCISAVHVKVSSNATQTREACLHVSCKQ